MIVKIKKRDGRTVTFNIEKIASAIYKAAQSVGGSDYETALELSGKVVDMLMSNNIGTPTVEQIQDCVEKVLIEEGHAATAKSYILYRSERTRAREMDTRLMKVYEDLTFKSAEDSDLKRENANIDGDTAMGTMLWALRSSMRCMCSKKPMHRLTRVVTYIYMIWISTPSRPLVPR